MELQLSGKGVIKMKAIQCCYFLALVSSHLMAGVMGDDNIFLSNSDSAALYCVAKIFPDGENILIYKVNIINASSKKDVFFYESPTSTHNDIMGGGGMSYAYEYDVKYNICHLRKKGLINTRMQFNLNNRGNYVLEYTVCICNETEIRKELNNELIVIDDINIDMRDDINIGIIKSIR